MNPNKNIVMKNVLKKTTQLLSFLAFTIVFFSCTEDAENTNSGTMEESEISSVLNAEAVSNTADTIITDLFEENGATQKQASVNKTDCYSITYTDNGYIATYNNCVLNTSDNINGSVEISFEIENESILYTADYSDFYIGEIKINGTKSFVVGVDNMQSATSFSVSSDITMVLEDDTVISENGTKMVTLNTGDTEETGTFTVDGDWMLTVNETRYIIGVQNVLEGALACDYLTSGIMTINKNDLEVKVNFGDGSCDAEATIIYPNGITEDFILNQ